MNNNVLRMASSEQKLKNQRARRLGALTNLRRRALVIVNARGSCTELTSLLRELDGAAEAVTEAHHEYIEVIVQEEQRATAEKSYSEAIQAYDATIGKIAEHLEERKEENSKPAKMDAERVSEHRTAPPQEAPRDPDPACDFNRSLPRLTLRTFSGDSSEWPTWYGLFKAMVHNQKSLNESQKMLYLQSSLGGIARQLISGMMCDPSLYPVALETLEERFGREEDIVRAKLDAVFNHPAPTGRTLQSWFATLNSAVTVLQRLGFTGDLHSQENLRRLVAKLPPELKREWAKHVVSRHVDTRADLHTFNSWLKDQVKIGLIAGPPPTRPSQPTRRQPEPRVAAAFTTQSHETSCCVCCGSTSHQLWDCETFKTKGPTERTQLVADKRCCFRCLRVGHRSRDYRATRVCGINGCQYQHHRLLHGSGRVRPGRQNTTDPDRNSQPTVASFAKVSAAPPTVLLQVVPVRVHGASGSTRDTLALLDPGAQTSLCRASVLQELGIRGQPQQLRLRNVEADGEERMSERVQLTVSPLADSEDHARLICVPEAYSVATVNVRTPTVSAKKSETWTHLQDIQIPDTTCGEVELFLGANCLEAVLQTEARVGQPGQPTAIRTAFGWSLTGSVFGCDTGTAREVMFVQDLTDSLRDWWTTESFGTKFTGESLSPEDTRAMKVLEETTRRVGPRYEVGLPLARRVPWDAR